MLNASHYSPNGFVTAACLAGTLLHYSFVGSSTFSTTKVSGILEGFERNSSQPTLYLVSLKKEKSEISHRGSGRINPSYL
ncbi:hypothetical protein [cf. Phormidesmis sp. LEGE 11477]|uniref:hypothetical protein n=1 Tax=cf. Phormidesmis sp. LEGE 11477 TaxID=1828680 RepID=UPI00187F001E|nr:hypothetical protein [cf. Phormidesmis sp. LEGE 11477]MBE9061135.1 hypothetical protein [cf. Phormidesmis sp. LEGE 11477]